jgi:hypothetical protein
MEDMPAKFNIPSSDPALFEKAARIAKEFVRPYVCGDIVGIVFLGAIARGYFDRHADIDIAVWKKRGSEIPIDRKFYKIEDIEVQVWLADYESELETPWDMPKRWTYSQPQIFHDPQGTTARLLEEKVPLKPEEKRWLLMSGLTLSEWYVNRLTRLWVERGNLISAHHMVGQGLIYFFDMLFGLNDELVPDMKWRYYCVEQLARLPRNFRERLRETMILNAFTVEELERRKQAFMEMWREARPEVEAEVRMTFEEMLEIV